MICENDIGDLIVSVVGNHHGMNAEHLFVEKFKKCINCLTTCKISSTKKEMLMKDLS